MISPSCSDADDDPILLTAIGGMSIASASVNIGLESMISPARWRPSRRRRDAASPLRWRRRRAGAALGLAMSIVVTRCEPTRIIVGSVSTSRSRAGSFLLRALRRLRHVHRRRRDAAPLDIPVVRDIPVVGAILSGEDGLTWFRLGHGPGHAFVLHQTRIGSGCATGSAKPPCARSA